MGIVPNDRVSTERGQLHYTDGKLVALGKFVPGGAGNAIALGKLGDRRRCANDDAMGVSRKCVRTWIDRYAAEGEAGLLCVSYIEDRKGRRSSSAVSPCQRRRCNLEAL